METALEILHRKKVILEPVLDRNFNINPTRDCWVGTLREINNAMKEYAAQFIDLAAEQADELGCRDGSSYATSESILKLKQQIK